ncbi:MAG: hypothetical protein NC204_02600 [Candidatus Amulumruptor caecigallinarius]|nr:hypothetical protein [Candidatus Amulumruptor caecigallinarius]
MVKERNDKPGSKTLFGQKETLSVYAVFGLTEWQALIRAGKALVRIPFTGGTVSGFGEVPATYKTTSRAIKTLIESSNYFRTGKIRRLQ